MGLKVACVQYRSHTDPEKNISQAHHLCEQISHECPDVIVLPEHTFFLGKLQDFPAWARPLDSEHPWMNRLRQWARNFRTVIIAGSLPEPSADKNRIYQTAVVMFPDDRPTLFFRKRLLFSGMGKSHPLDESEVIARGEHPYLAFDIQDWRVGLTLCVELRYSQVFHSMRYKGGCDLTIIPASFYAHTGRDHFLPLLTARAIEFQMAVVSANQCALPEEKTPTFIGQSCIIDSWGRALSVANTWSEALCFQELSKETLRQTRTQIDMRQNVAATNGNETRQPPKKLDGRGFHGACY